MTNVPHHIETSQLIRIANQLINHCKTGFYIWGKHCSLMGLRILSNIYVRAFIRKLLTPFSGKRQNMLTLFHLLSQLALTISETEVNYYHQKLFSHLLPKYLRPTKFQENLKTNCRFSLVPSLLSRNKDPVIKLEISHKSLNFPY